MPKIRIKSVQCTTPDEIDKDEMYLKMDGKKIWPEGERYHRVDTGDVSSVNLDLEVKEGWNEIEVWDFDFVSANNLLGVFKFKVDLTPGDYSTSMKLLERDSTASYLLFWEILDKDGNSVT
ncbi:MAG: hypothetical protein HRT61_13130 [Ekhidna sp.]|nr:hypothetical protein [Ekhidna sp.]